MRYTAYAGCIVAAALVAGCSNAPDTGKVSDDISAAMSGAITAFNAHDAEKSVAIDAPGYIGMMHGMANVTGPAQDLALTKTLLADPAAKLEAPYPEVNVAAAGDMGIWKATYNYTYTDPKTKAPATEQGNWVVVFRRQQDGTMKATLGIVSDTAPAAAAAAPAT